MTILMAWLAALAVHPVFYTNHNFYYKITARDPFVFGATNGGLVEYNTATGAYRSLNDADGLTMNRLNCLGLDSSGAVWTGSENGICLVDPDFQSVLTYPVDCVPCSRIHALMCLKDTVIFGTGNGVLRLETMGTTDVFADDLRLEVYDTDGLPSNNITALAGNDRIWVGTDAGLARCTKDFSQIDVYTAAQGLLDNRVDCVACRDTLVLVGTRAGLNRYHAGRFDTLFAGFAVRDIEISGDTVLVALDSLRQVGVYYAGSLQICNSGLPWLVRVNDLAQVGGDWAAGLGNAYDENYFGEGIGQLSFAAAAPVWTMEKDRCLPSNHISDICSADSGVFVALGARDNVSRGIGWLKNDGSWTHFTNDSVLPSNHIHRCETAPDGRPWFAMNPISNAGPDTFLCFSLDPAEGAWRFLGTRFLDTTYNTDAVWDIKFDPAGDMYLEIGRPSNRLWVVDAALAQACAIQPIQPGFYDEIAVDTSGRIWRSIADDPGGLVMTNTNHTLFVPSDDNYYIYSMNDGLLSNYARGCVVDEDDNLYVATDVGLSVHHGQQFTNYEGFSDAEPLDVCLGSDHRIWILTRSGIYYQDPFYKTIQGWTFGELGISLEFITESKEVIQIQGFTFDARRGCFWIGGSNGLLKLEIVHDDSLPLDSITVYPNPAVQGDVIRIKNLPPDAVVSVYSVAGRCLAKEIEPDQSFGEVFWRIPAGTPSGLYFALIRSGLGKRIAKFAIVR